MLEVVGEVPTGLNPKQIARRCEITPAAAYRMLRTLSHEGYVLRRDDGRYTLGLAVADRFRELVVAMRGPAEVGELMRRASAETGFSHYLGSFVDGRVAITAVAEGPRSPYVEDLVPGFDEGAHATALGKTLLASLEPFQRERYLKEQGMRAFTQATLRSPSALEADIAAGLRRGMQVEIGQFRPGVACAAVTVVSAGEPSQRYAIACALPAAELMKHAPVIRERLYATARNLAKALATPQQP
jgi:DNA-binding IclR family transcriptional regulator